MRARAVDLRRNHASEEYFALTVAQAPSMAARQRRSRSFRSIKSTTVSRIGKDMDFPGWLSCRPHTKASGKSYQIMRVIMLSLSRAG